jgi:hypothetical protein
LGMRPTGRRGEPGDVTDNTKGDSGSGARSIPAHSRSDRTRSPSRLARGILSGATQSNHVPIPPKLRRAEFLRTTRSSGSAPKHCGV